MTFEDQIRKMFRYEPDTGFLFWTEHAHRSVKNKQANTTDRLGYIQVPFQGKRLRAHRIGWFLTHGSWPSQMIDHIDGNPTNNALANLRDVNNQVNQWNRSRARVDSKSGLIGASPYKGKWRSQIKRDGVINYLGFFDTAVEAHNAYMTAKFEFDKREKNTP
jgi:hypothetical protein